MATTTQRPVRWVVTFTWSDGEKVRFPVTASTSTEAWDSAYTELVEQVGPSRARESSYSTTRAKID
jgi:hypothetical protein